MSTTSAKRSSVLLSLVAIGAAFCFGLAQAQAGDDNVTEDQIVRALAPPKKPLTRGLSIGPQTDPVATEAGVADKPEKAAAPAGDPTGGMGGMDF